MKKLLLIDGHSILNRAFYGLPDLMNSKGQHTNAVLGFFNIMMKIIEEEKPDYLTVAFDVKHPTFRHKIYEEYKGNRKPSPQEFTEQVPLMKELLGAMGVHKVELAGYEADDLLGTIAHIGESKGLAVSLLSGDRDLLQIASNHIKIRIPKTKKGGTEIEDYYADQVKELYGVTPLEFIDMKALMGDPSDNIPGVTGIGEKTAAKIIMKYGSIENAIANVEDIMPKRAKEALQGHEDMARLSKVLATIKTDCPIEYNLEDAKCSILFTKEAYELCQQLEFKSILSRYFTSAPISTQYEEKFTCVADQEQAEEVFQKAEQIGLVGTACINASNSRSDVLLGISIAFEEEVFWLPKGNVFTKEYLLSRWQQMLTKLNTAVFLDLKENLPFIEEKEAYKSDSVWFDAGIAAYLLNPLNETYHYDDIARNYLGITVPSKVELFGKVMFSSDMIEYPENFLKYVCYTSQIPLKAYTILNSRLKEQNMEALFYDMELPLIKTLYHMEHAGIRVDKEALRSYGDKLKVRITQIEEGIYKQVGETFNINSPKQLGEIIFEKMGLEGGKKTKTGYSTKADILEKLAPEHPVIREILEYRQLTKLSSTYAEGLAAYINDDGRIHSTFNQTITATGRISSTEPNLQNIPIKMEIGREIRKVFLPEDGFVFIDADYSQIELRVLAHMSKDERLLEAYRMDKDIHRITASQVFHVPFEEVTSEQRRNAKAVNFGIVYGISSFGLSQDLSISKSEAQVYIDKYFEAYPKIKDFLDRLVGKAKENKYTETLFQRRRPIPELLSSNYMTRSFGERIAMNAPIQGTAADIIKLAMIRVDQRLREADMKSRLILQVHDELLVEAHASEIEEVKKILNEEMVHVIPDFSVALEIDMHIGNNWFETK